LHIMFIVIMLWAASIDGQLSSLVACHCTDLYLFNLFVHSANKLSHSLLPPHLPLSLPLHLPLPSVMHIYLCLYLYFAFAFTFTHIFTFSFIFICVFTFTFAFWQY